MQIHQIDMVHTEPSQTLLGLSNERLAPAVDDSLFFVVPVGTDFVRDDGSIAARPQRRTEYPITTTVITI